MIFEETNNLIFPAFTCVKKKEETKKEKHFKV